MHKHEDVGGRKGMDRGTSEEQVKQNESSGHSGKDKRNVIGMLEEGLG